MFGRLRTLYDLFVSETRWPLKYLPSWLALCVCQLVCMYTCTYLYIALWLIPIVHSVYSQMDFSPTRNKITSFGELMADMDDRSTTMSNSRRSSFLSKGTFYLAWCIWLSWHFSKREKKAQRKLFTVIHENKDSKILEYRCSALTGSMSAVVWLIRVDWLIKCVLLTIVRVICVRS